MKIKIIFLLLTISVINTNYAQSISASRILSFLESQDFNKIELELILYGFLPKGKDNIYNNEIYSFSKSDKFGMEYIKLGKNNELFFIAYKPVSKDFFQALKSKLLTSEFIFINQIKNNKYYESDNMRIGINNKNNFLTFFVKLN